MKKLLYSISLALIIVISTNIQAAERIAIANIASIFQQLPQRNIIAKQLENEFKGRSTELQLQELDIQNKIQKLQINKSKMKASERNRIERDIIIQREKFSNKAQIFDQDRRYRQIQERNKLLSRIHDAIKKVAKSQGYDIVINAEAIAYVSHEKDITNDVLKQVK
ncbi:OmpH family outer membrane protein [Pantoea sp. Mhis]|uniref:OmpH family outer membrane protein n=1 Tax=Pantoea sp. Mhis TaxID=2576759 RepID=UPI00135CF64E|nr:OmpH family outer membrane protein [Pantoea sp. Mhis]MXP56357.1 molecular chaperone [Pantoea sp. Mhis]